MRSDAFAGVRERRAGFWSEITMTCPSIHARLDGVYMTLIWPHRVYRCLRKKSHERSHNTYTYVSCIQYTKFLSLDLHSFPSERCPFGSVREACAGVPRGVRWARASHGGVRDITMCNNSPIRNLYKTWMPTQNSKVLGVRRLYLLSYVFCCICLNIAFS